MSLTACRCPPETLCAQTLCLQLVTFKQALTGQDIWKAVHKLLSKAYNLQPWQVLGFGHDSVAANGVAMDLSKAVYDRSVDIGCHSHFLNNAGQRLALPTLAAFTKEWIGLIYAGTGVKAKHIWSEIIGGNVVGNSSVRWYCKFEIQAQIARNFSRLSTFFAQCDTQGLDGAYYTKLKSFMADANNAERVALELAALLDIEKLVETCYALEGDRLEVLLTYRRIEELRAMGRAIEACQEGCLPNVDAILRKSMPIYNGLEVEKRDASGARIGGSVTGSTPRASTNHPGTTAPWLAVQWADGTSEEYEHENLRPLVLVHKVPVRAEICNGISPVFKYIEERLNSESALAYGQAVSHARRSLSSHPAPVGILVCADACLPRYYHKQVYALMKAARVIDPSVACALSADELIAELKHLLFLSGELKAGVPALGDEDDYGGSIDQAELIHEVPNYQLVAARSTSNLRHTDVSAFTSAVLDFWRANEEAIPVTAALAKVVCSWSASAAACERVFSALKNQMNDQQGRALMDYVCGSVMLKYNKRIATYSS